MSIWQHGTASTDLPYITAIGSAKIHHCQYCKNTLERIAISDVKEEGGVLRDGQGVVSETVNEVSDHLYLCVNCCWWHRHGHGINFRCDRSFRSETWSASVGVLRALSLEEMTTPITEVRSFLMAKYSARFSMHPRLLEETVASVFSTLGYVATTTAYSRDGGIDVILRQDDREIGVQVKRHRDKIGVAQIRELVGALTLRGGMHAGMFVTVSGYTKGAIHEAGVAQTIGMPVELIDAQAFFQKLSLAQSVNADEIRERAILTARKSWMPTIHKNEGVVRWSD